MRVYFSVVVIFGMGLAVLLSSTATTQQPNAADDAADPQTRGPLHEAFAEPAGSTPQPGPIVPKKPPEPIEEMPPDQKPEGRNVQWLPGYWIFDDEAADFLWVSGFWRDVPPERRWVPGYWTQVDDDGWQRVAGFWEEAGQSEIEYLPPPPRNIDAGPSTPPPATESVYVPGCWIHHETRFLWRPGFWIAANPNWVYVPARYTWTPGGCIFTEGFWDYPLETRGVLFCPVVIDRTVWRPTWVFRSHHVIATPALLTALFARPAFGHYYFGDYFATGYVKAGFIAWTDYTPVRNVPNPLFGHYQAHRDRAWVAGIQQVYRDRREGRLPPPPASFKQQTQIIQNITQVTNVNNTIQINQQHYKVGNAKALTEQMTLVAPLTQVTKINKDVKMHAVSKEAMAGVQQHVAQIKQVSQERHKFDAKVAQNNVKADKAGQPKPLAKLALPKVAETATQPKNEKVKQPPRPPAPKPVVMKAPEPHEIKPARLDGKPSIFHPKEEKKADKLPPSKEEKKVDKLPPSKEEKKADKLPPSKEEKKADKLPPSKEEKKVDKLPPSKEEKKVDKVPPPKLEKKTDKASLPMNERPRVDPPKEKVKNLPDQRLSVAPADSRPSIQLLERLSVNRNAILRQRPSRGSTYS